MTMHVRFRVRSVGTHHEVRVFVGPSVDHTLALAGTLRLRSRRTGNFTNTNDGADELEPFRFALATAPGVTFDLIDEDGQVVAAEDAVEHWRSVSEHMARGFR